MSGLILPSFFHKWLSNTSNKLMSEMTHESTHECVINSFMSWLHDWDEKRLGWERRMKRDLHIWKLPIYLKRDLPTWKRGEWKETYTYESDEWKETYTYESDLYIWKETYLLENVENEKRPTHMKATNEKRPTHKKVTYTFEKRPTYLKMWMNS